MNVIIVVFTGSTQEELSQALHKTTLSLLPKGTACRWRAVRCAAGSASSSIRAHGRPHPGAPYGAGGGQHNRRLTEGRRELEPYGAPCPAGRTSSCRSPRSATRGPTPRPSAAPGRRTAPEKTQIYAVTSLKDLSQIM